MAIRYSVAAARVAGFVVSRAGVRAVRARAVAFAMCVFCRSCLSVWYARYVCAAAARSVDAVAGGDGAASRSAAGIAGRAASAV